MSDFESNLRQTLGYDVVLTAHHRGLRYWPDASDEIKRLLMLQEDVSYQYQHAEDKYKHSKPYISKLFKEVMTCK
jgi:hypothetical protein